MEADSALDLKQRRNIRTGEDQLDRSRCEVGRQKASDDERRCGRSDGFDGREKRRDGERVVDLKEWKSKHGIRDILLSCKLKTHWFAEDVDEAAVGQIEHRGEQRLATGLILVRGETRRREHADITRWTMSTELEAVHLDSEGLACLYAARRGGPRRSA